MKHIIFAQLPLPDHSMGYINGNIQYAPSILTGFINIRHKGTALAEMLPFIISNFGSNLLISDYICKVNPEIVCFTCYSWNIERHLRIAENIKKINREIKIIFGGPEISTGSYFFESERRCVDLSVQGEGEWFLDIFLSSESSIKPELINGNYTLVQPENSPVPVKNIHEPGRNRYLDLMPDGSTCFELTRGCPYRCKYCYYSKNCSSVREIPFKYLLELISIRKSISDLYILSPAFDRSTNFIDKLKQLRDVQGNVRLHTELRADRIDRETAELMYSAGFRSVEAGLQTLNRQSLEAIKRDSDTEKELEGMKVLMDSGIELKIGIIPGLPHESFNSFTKTIDRLVNAGFSDFIEIYPLMILPGTGIRDMAIDEKIDYQSMPPYYYLNGWGMDYDDISEVIEYTENVTGLSQSIRYLPDFFTGNEGLYINTIQFDGNSPGNWNINRYKKYMEASVFTFHINLDSVSSLYSGITSLLNNLDEDYLINLVLYLNQPIDEIKLSEIITDNTEDALIERINIFNSFKEKQRIRFFQIFSDENSFFIADTEYSFVDTVYFIDSFNERLMKKIHSVEGAVLISRKFSVRIMNMAADIYSDCPELVAFQDENSQETFYKMTGFSHTKLPFSFRKIDIH